MNAVTRYLASRDNRFFRVSLGLATALGLWGLRLPGFDLVFILAALVVLLIAALLARKYRGKIPRPFEGGLEWHYSGG
ncbi:hypothetical protein [Luteolibacter luteus]|uniref:Uncharacterized protein n=1 Tax=Luteolibacter luteus TaxID=2728835 RepID=A0A858RPY3_9BACT|nr:hypothetical protein [Luteolibacter luteus]QJE98681.1 hypothetical protein HHL09_23820 [Luteolibacter luteus]